jgi:cell division septation protein DedD
LNKVALILSFIYCGFGQLYKREIMKGIDFIVIFTFLIAFFFYLPVSPLFHFIILFAMILMWILGMVDGYLDEEVILGGMIWIKLMDIFSASIITIAITTLIIVGMQNFPSWEKNPVNNVNTKTTQVNQIVNNKVNNPEITVAPKIETNLVEQNSVSPALVQTEQNIIKEVKENPPNQQQTANITKPDQIEENKIEKAQPERYFIIQVGAFSKKSSAESIADQLKKNNYTLVEIIEPTANENNKLYKVRIGKFETKDTAKKTAQELENENPNIKAIILSP